MGHPEVTACLTALTSQKSRGAGHPKYHFRRRHCRLFYFKMTQIIFRSKHLRNHSDRNHKSHFHKAVHIFSCQASRHPSARWKNKPCWPTINSAKLRFPTTLTLQRHQDNIYTQWHVMHSLGMVPLSTYPQRKPIWRHASNTCTNRYLNYSFTSFELIWFWSYKQRRNGGPWPQYLCVAIKC